MKIVFLYLFATLIFNTAIAGVLTLLISDTSFNYQFIYSQCIGLSILLTHLVMMHYVRPGTLRWLIFSVSMPLSVVIGLTLAQIFSGMGSWGDENILRTVLIAIFFGLVGTVIVLLSERINSEIQHRKYIESESEKRKIEAQLKLLQAQIEPHFLFNTLANVNCLIETDPILAKRLLEHLIDWLRVALSHTRNASGTLGDELDMLENYLHILKIRFGERLAWHIDVNDKLRCLTFPPMLLQPLVENAVTHGIEPKIGGGKIDICASDENSLLRIVVSDSGVGLNERAAAHGTGLKNVRARLATLFGANGTLLLAHNGTSGTVATLQVPK